MWEDLSKVIFDLKTLLRFPIALPQNTGLHDLSLLTSHHIIHLLGVPLGSTILLPPLQQIAFYLTGNFCCLLTQTSTWISVPQKGLPCLSMGSKAKATVTLRCHSCIPFIPILKPKLLALIYWPSSLFSVKWMSRDQWNPFGLTHWTYSECLQCLAFHRSLKTCLLIIEWVIDCSLIPNRFVYTRNRIITEYKLLFSHPTLKTFLLFSFYQALQILTSAFL